MYTIRTIVRKVITDFMEWLHETSNTHNAYVFVVNGTWRIGVYFLRYVGDYYWLCPCLGFPKRIDSDEWKS